MQEAIDSYKVQHTYNVISKKVKKALLDALGINATAKLSLKKIDIETDQDGIKIWQTLFEIFSKIQHGHDYSALYEKFHNIRQVGNIRWYIYVDAFQRIHKKIGKKFSWSLRYRQVFEGISWRL